MSRNKTGMQYDKIPFTVAATTAEMLICTFKTVISAFEFFVGYQPIKKLSPL